MIYTIKNNDFILSIFPTSVQVLHDKENDRIKRLKHHIKGNDYFGTLATILDLMDQVTDSKINELVQWQKEHNQDTKKLKADLLHLQKHYKIVKRQK